MSLSDKLIPIDYYKWQIQFDLTNKIETNK